MQAEEFLGNDSHKIIELAHALSGRYLALTVRSCQLSAGDSFLHVTSENLAQSSLEYLPTFHVIVSENQDGGGFDVRLLSYNGKVLETERLSWSGEEYVASQHLERLNCGLMKLCSGLDDVTEEQFSSGFPQLVREFLDDRLVFRSQQCQYAIMQSENSEVQCRFCAAESERLKVSSYPSSDIILEDLVKNEPLQFEALVKEETEGLMNDLKGDGNASLKKRKRRTKTSSGKEKRKTRQVKKKIPPIQDEKLDDDLAGFEDFEVNFDDDQMDLEEKEFSKMFEEPIMDENDVNGKCLNTCQKCGRDYKSKYPYYKHIQKCHYGKEVLKFSENCQICLKNFDHKKHLEKHMDFHRSKHDLYQPVSCPECNETFQTKYELNPHYQAAHCQAKGCCIVCLEVVEASQLRRHLYNRHFYNIKDRLCPTCGESFATPLKLRVHISSVHDDSGEWKRK